MRVNAASNVRVRVDESMSKNGSVGGKKRERGVGGKKRERGKKKSLHL